MERITPIVNIILKIDAFSLKDRDVLENLIRLFGLSKRPNPKIYGKDSIYMVDSEKETSISQNPRQFAEALIFLSDLNIQSFVEIGTYQGGSFILLNEYLKRFSNEDFYGFTMDITDEYLKEDVKNYLSENFGIIKSEFTFPENLDLVFIDADHTYNAVKQDYEYLGKYAKYCMFHDALQPDCEVTRFWNEIKKGKEYWEFSYHSEDYLYMGIGIIKN